MLRGELKLEIDNKGSVDLNHSLNIGGNTRHMEVRYFVLRDKILEGLLKLMWMNGEDNEADLFTKNLGLVPFEKHGKQFVGHDEYMSPIESQGEGVAVWCVAPECATEAAVLVDQPLEDSWDPVDGEVSNVGSKDSTVEWMPIEDDSHEYWWD